MRIRGAVDGIDGPGIPSSLADRIDIRSTVELLPNEIMAIGAGLNVMAKSFETEPPVIRNKALLLFIPGSRYSVELDGDEMGATKTFLVFPVHMWRKLNPDDTLVPYLAVVEEMRHCFYGIADETEVKHKVLDITNKYVDADAKFENLFPGWKDASVSYSA